MQLRGTAALSLALGLAALACSQCFGYRLPDNEDDNNVFKDSNKITFPVSDRTLYAYEEFKRVDKKLAAFDIESLISSKAAAMRFMHAKYRQMRQLLNKETIVDYSTLGASIVSSAMGILGTAMAPVTGGVSLVLTAGGTALGAASTATDVVGDAVIDNYESRYLNQAHRRSAPVQSAYLELRVLALEAANAYGSFQSAILRDLKEYSRGIRANVTDAEIGANSNKDFAEFIWRLSRYRHEIYKFRSVLRRVRKSATAMRKVKKFLKKLGFQAALQGAKYLSVKMVSESAKKVVSSAWSIVTGVFSIFYDSYQIKVAADTNYMGTETLRELKNFIKFLGSSCEAYEEFYSKLLSSYEVSKKLFVQQDGNSNFNFDLAFFRQYSKSSD